MDSIRFHTPAEHTLFDVEYDLEMQIIAKDVQERADQCKSYTGAFSLFFTIDDDATESDFWDWVGKEELPNVDLNKLFTITTPMTTKMYGYVGSDSMPSCTPQFCWYLAEPLEGTNTITTATLQQL